MNKKILSTLMATCLLVSSAIPAFAISSQSGLDSDITGLSFQKDSYTVKQGETIDLYGEVMALAGTTRLVQEPNLLWSYQNDNNFAFNLDDTTGIAEAIEVKGTAVITVTTQDGKVKATTKLVASGASRIQDATGYTFDKTAYNLLTGDQYTKETGDTITLISLPTGSQFTKEQQTLLEGTPLVIDFSKNSTPYQPISVKGNINDDRDKIIFQVDEKTMKSLTTQKSVQVNYKIDKFPASYPNGTVKQVNITRTIRVDSKLARKADAIYGLGNKTIEVGEKIKASDLFKQGPSAHNVALSVDYGTDFVDQNATILDYADIVYGQSLNTKTRATIADEEVYVQGVAVGKNKITGTLANGKQASVIVTVVAKGQLPNELVKISTTAATLKINEPLKLTLSNIPAGKEVTWKVVENTIAQISVFKGASTTVYPKKAGKAIVSAIIDGQVVATSEITVSNEYATGKPGSSGSVGSSGSSGKPNKPGSTSNPQTSDLLLGNLIA